MSKIIFLDIDGVLNDFKTIFATGKDFPTRDHLDCLKQIVDATGAEIVLSSSWRFYKSDLNDVKNALRNVNLKLLDKTKELPKGRDAEIREWLSRHPEVENYVILDDHNDEVIKFSTELEKHLVLTASYTGLLPEHVEKAIEILNKIS